MPGVPRLLDINSVTCLLIVRRLRGRGARETLARLRGPGLALARVGGLAVARVGGLAVARVSGLHRRGGLRCVRGVRRRVLRMDVSGCVWLVGGQSLGSHRGLERGLAALTVCDWVGSLSH